MTPRHPFVMAIVERAASFYGTDAETILSKNGTRTVREARAVCMYVVRKLYGWSTPEVAAAFERDHTGVLTMCKRVQQRMEGSPRMAEAVRALLAEGERAR